VALIAGCRQGKQASEQDALWRLAPLTASQGVVITGRGLRAVEGTWREIDRLLDSSPELGLLAEVLRPELPLLFPGGEVSLARAGMTTDRGAAFFASPSGARIMFLPVIDRAAFVRYVSGTTADDGDRVGDLTCRPVGDRYACAKPVELLGRVGGGIVGDHIGIAGTRGDVEVAIATGDDRIAAVGLLERGSFVMRGAIRAASLRGKLINASAQQLDLGKLAGFGVFHLGPALTSLPVPREPLAAGMSLADLVGEMAGPILVSFPPGLRQGEIRVPMKDTRVARALVAHCEDIAYLAILSSTVQDGACHLTVPGLSLDVEVRVDGNDLRARTTNAAPVTATLRPTAIARELASGAWAFALYGRGTVLTPFHPTEQEISHESMLAVRVLTWLSEAGVGVRADGDLLRFVVAIRTVWSNPPEVVAKWLALPLETILDPAGLETARQIAATAPTAPLGDDLAGGTAVVASIAALAMVAGVVVGKVADKDLRALARRDRASTPAEALEKLAELKDAMCTCRDATCAERVSHEMTAWSMDQARGLDQPPRLSEAETKRAAAIGEQMGACMQAAFVGAAPSAASEYIAKNIELKDRLCACEDVACGEAVSREMTAWSEAFVSKLPAGSTMSLADDRQMQEIEDQVSSCMLALRTRVP
jgi:hypothetical protein